MNSEAVPWDQTLGEVTHQDIALCALGRLSNDLSRLKVRVFGSLVKGLSVGLDLLKLLQKEVRVFSLLLKIFGLLMLTGNDGQRLLASLINDKKQSNVDNYLNNVKSQGDTNRRLSKSVKSQSTFSNRLKTPQGIKVVILGGLS
ncbi:hypothetical protein L2E82_38961 [Cichorium intybus]|uniref:Uncharacterized protein n=1 Tax=Cichorium intybus TaxID=13427 RepID=A0ACB9AGC4_CICIN|nr:hypothetical protein L2E82_38961 [Cichorium intybus]